MLPRQEEPMPHIEETLGIILADIVGIRRELVTPEVSLLA